METLGVSTKSWTIATNGVPSTHYSEQENVFSISARLVTFDVYPQVCQRLCASQEQGLFLRDFNWGYFDVQK